MNSYVFDTNCIISAYLLPNSILRKAYDKGLQEGILLHSSETLTELVQVFSRRKFDKYISIEGRLDAIKEFEKKSFYTDIIVDINACRDAKDNKFLELAVSGQATQIITGDKDLLVLNPFETITIITPAIFLANQQ